MAGIAQLPQGYRYTKQNITVPEQAADYATREIFENPDDVARQRDALRFLSTFAGQTINNVGALPYAMRVGRNARNDAASSQDFLDKNRAQLSPDQILHVETIISTDKKISEQMEEIETFSICEGKADKNSVLWFKTGSRRGMRPATLYGLANTVAQGGEYASQHAVDLWDGGCP